MNNYTWQVFWLSCFSGGPSRSVEQWLEEIPKKRMQDYSYGDSSGFTPDSLLIHRR